MIKAYFTAQEFKKYFWEPFSELCKDKQLKKMLYCQWKDINDRLKNPQTKVTIEFNKDHPNIMIIGNFTSSLVHDDGGFGSFLNQFNPELVDLDSYGNTAEKNVQNLIGNTSIEYKNYDSNKRKEEKNMFGNFDFGPVDSSVRMSAYGLAIKNSSGTWVSYDTANKCIMDVDILNFEGGNKFMYKMPVTIKDISVGDVIVHNRRPLFVVAVRSDGKLACVDPYEGEEKVVMLARSMFGFDFITKVVCLLNFKGASPEQPFGNLLPLMLLGDKNIDPMMAVALTGGLGNMTQNHLLLYALMNKDSKSDDMLPLLLLANGGLNLTATPCASPVLQNGNSGPCAVDSKE